MLALALRIGSAASFAALLAVVKYVGQTGVALPEIMFWRQAACLPWLLGWMVISGRLHQLRTRRIGSHGRRAALGMFNMGCNFGATILLPLAEATTLGFTTPLFAVLIAVLVWREKVGPYRWLAVLLGFAGVLVIAQPGGHPVNGLGVTLAMITAVLVTLINYQIRDLGRTEAPVTTVFYFSLFGSLLTAPALPFVMSHHSPLQWVLLVLVGSLGALGQVLMTASLRFGVVTSVMVMDYTALIWATLIGWQVWGDVPSLATFLGAPLIVGAGLIIAVREHRLQRRTAADPRGAQNAD